MQPSPSSLKRTLFSLLCLAIVFWGGYTFGHKGYQLELQRASNIAPKVTISRGVPLNRKELDFNLFWKVWDRVSELYVDANAIDSEKMVYGAISGMVSALGDPYTVFLPPRENKDSKDSLGGSFEGVGIQLGFNKDKRLTVVAPIDGSPAFRAGVKAGDLILAITDSRNGIEKETTDLSLPEAVDLIRGPRGTVVKLKLYREGVDKPFEVELSRETIVVSSVEVSFREVDTDAGRGKVAILELKQFGSKTDREWISAVSKIKEEEKKGKLYGIVLDLRNNPGGYLDASVWIASEFLKSGKVVVKQENRETSTNQSFEVMREGRLLSEPVVVLINGGTASAAEILAGALRSHERAILIGEKSFGKGTVQQPEDFPGGAGIHVTVGKWLLPDGEWIDKKGVEPTIKIENDTDEKIDEQLEAAITELTL